MSADVECTIRPSVAAMAGCVAGYRSTARAAALHARANSISLAVSSGASGSVSINPDMRSSRCASQVRERVDAQRFRIDRLDDRPWMLAAGVAFPGVGQQRLLEPVALRIGNDLDLRPERIARMFGRDHRQFVRVQANQV